jgi:hypothetical protein
MCVTFKENASRVAIWDIVLKERRIHRDVHIQKGLFWLVRKVYPV